MFGLEAGREGEANENIPAHGRKMEILVGSFLCVQRIITNVPGSEMGVGPMGTYFLPKTIGMRAHVGQVQVTSHK